MKVLNAIFGILSILASVYCMCYPGMTFLNTGWIITVLLGGWGLCVIIDYFAKRKQAKDDAAQKNEKIKAANGVVSLILGIAAAVIAILSMFIPRINLMMDLIVVIMFAVWLIFNGCSSISTALTIGRKLKTKTWGWTLALGIITALCGVYGLCHLLVMMRTMGLMFGVILMLYGVRLLGSLFEKAE